MGAEFNTYFINKDLTKEEAIAEVEEHIENCKYEYGHGGYSGSMAECTGVSVAHTPTFVSEEIAESWLDDNVEKWGPALLVKTPLGWVAGALCSS